MLNLRLPPVRGFKLTIPVKAAQEAGYSGVGALALALTGMVCEGVTRTGSRGRGSGCGRRWTGKRAGGADHVRQEGRSGTAWATPLGRNLLCVKILMGCIPRNWVCIVTRSKS